MVSFAQAIPDARDIINDFNNDIDLFLDGDREQIAIHTYVENRSARAFLPLFNIIRDLVDQIDHLSTGEAWDLAVILSDEINALKSIINVLKSDLDKTKLALEANRKDSIMNTLPDDLEEKIRTLLGGAPKIESMEDNDSFDLTTQNLYYIIHGAVNDFQTLMGKEDFFVEIKCDPSIQLNADEQLLREAFINLLDNAIKYGDPDQGISITVEMNASLIIQFQNHGEPIPEKYKDRIFQRFYRIDKSRSRRQGGTGLGLAIVKHIIFVHGGDISVTSDKVSGTKFLIEIPL